MKTMDEKAFVNGASRTRCDILFNREWLIQHWYQKPAHFEDAEGFPQWYDFLKRVTPSDPYFVDGTPRDWSPVQYYNTKWKPRYIEQASVCFLLDQGESVALGVFQPDAKGKTKRRASLQKAVTGILLDVDEGIPPDIVTCNDLIEAVPFLKYATGIRESVSSRSERKDGISQFRTYFGLEKPIPVDCQGNQVAVRARENLGEWLASRSLYAPEGLAKNAVCVGYGNAGTRSKYDSDYLICDDFVQEMMREAEAEIAAETREKEKRQQRRRQNSIRRDGIQGDARSPIEAFIEDEDPIQYMEQQGWITHSQGSEYHWHESSTAGRSCLIENGIIKPFSATLQGASPANEKPVNAHRFIIYHETKLDISEESNRPEIRKILADRGYGMSIEAFKRKPRRGIPPLSEVLRAEAAAMQRSIQKAPETQTHTAAPPKLLQMDTDTPPETQTLEENRVQRAKAADRFLSDETAQETTHILLVKDSTGSGKTSTYIAKAQEHGKRTLAQLPHTELAQQAVNIAFQAGFKNPCHLLGREHNWKESGIADIPVHERTSDLFSRNNCIMVDVLKSYTDKRIAPRTFCEHFCPHHYETDGKNICPHLAQYEGLGDRDFVASCTPNLLFDVAFRGYLQSLVTAVDEPKDEDFAIDAMMGTQSKEQAVFDFAILDDYGVDGLYTDITFTGEEFKQLSKVWSGTPTAAFAKLMLKAFKKKKPHKILKALRTAFESTADNHEAIAESLTQHARNGTVQFAERPKSSKETRRLLTEKVVKYEDGGMQFIPVDFDAYKELRAKEIPTLNPQHLQTQNVGDKVRVEHTTTGALLAGVHLESLTPTWAPGATPIQLLDIFLKSIGNAKNAPITRTFRTGNPPVPVLTFSISPQAPVGILPHIAMLSATTDTTDTKRAFNGQAVTFSEQTGGQLEWADGVTVYQFQDGRLTSSSVFDYEKDAEGRRKRQDAPLGLTKTATERLQKLNRWAKGIDGLTAFISYKEFTETLGKVVDGFDVVTHFDKVAGLNFDGLKFLVVFGYPKVKHEVVIEHARKQYASDSETLPKGSYAELTEIAAYQEDGLTINERRYLAPRLEKVRHQLATEKIEQALGRARFPVWTDITTILFSNAPIAGVTERTTLFSSAAFNLAESASEIPDAMARIKQAAQSGDIQAVMAAKAVRKSQAYELTKDKRGKQKADRDARIIELHSEGNSQREMERILKNEGYKKASRKVISKVVQNSSPQLVYTNWRSEKCTTPSNTDVTGENTQNTQTPNEDTAGDISRRFSAGASKKQIATEMKISQDTVPRALEAEICPRFANRESQEQIATPMGIDEKNFIKPIDRKSEMCDNIHGDTRKSQCLYHFNSLRAEASIMRGSTTAVLLVGKIGSETEEPHE